MEQGRACSENVSENDRRSGYNGRGVMLSLKYDSIMWDKDLDVNSIMCLRGIKGLAQYICFNEDYYGHLLSLKSIWGNCVFEYTSLTFYPNLPDVAKEEYGIYDLIKLCSAGKFRLDDYKADSSRNYKILL